MLFNILQEIFLRNLCISYLIILNSVKGYTFHINGSHIHIFIYLFINKQYMYSKEALKKRLIELQH